MTGLLARCMTLVVVWRAFRDRGRIRRTRPEFILDQLWRKMPPDLREGEIPQIIMATLAQELSRLYVAVDDIASVMVVPPLDYAAGGYADAAGEMIGITRAPNEQDENFRERVIHGYARAPFAPDQRGT